MGALQITMGVIGVLVSVVAWSVFVSGVLRQIRIIRLGQPDSTRNGPFGPRMRNLIKELEIELVNRVLSRLESIVGLLNNEQQTAEFHELKETSELELYFRFLDSQSFEKKLRGVNGIRDYVNRIDVGNWSVGDAKTQRRPLVHFDAKGFTRWVLEKKVIEMGWV